jgi:predicted phage terminase large subunit-like protein
VAEFKAAGKDSLIFDVIHLEAICEHPERDPLHRKLGEALWPEKWSVEALEGVKLTIGNYEWNAQYQQRPNPPGGNLTDINKIQYISRDMVPPNIQLERAWDLAASTKTVNDYSAGAYGGMDAEGNFYLVHVDRAKRLWPSQRDTMVRYAKQEATGGRIGVEAIGGFQTAVSQLSEVLRGDTIVVSFTATPDKIVHAIPWFAKIDGKKFFLVTGTWNQDFTDEVEQFPNGSHDDQVDAVSLLFDMCKKRRVYYDP